MRLYVRTVEEMAPDWLKTPSLLNHLDHIPGGGDNAAHVCTHARTHARTHTHVSARAHTHVRAGTPAIPHDTRYCDHDSTRSYRKEGMDCWRAHSCVCTSNVQSSSHMQRTPYARSDHACATYILCDSLRSCPRGATVPSPRAPTRRRQRKSFRASPCTQHTESEREREREMHARAHTVTHAHERTHKQTYHRRRGARGRAWVSVSACACLRLCFCECWLSWYSGWISGWIQVLTSRPGVALDTIQDRAIYGPPQHARAHERAHTSNDVQQLMGSARAGRRR